MAVYLTNEEAGFLDRSPEQLEILVNMKINEYPSACIPIGINFYFGQVIYRGNIHLFKENKYLFEQQHTKIEKDGQDKYQMLLSKEVTVGGKIWKRKVIHQRTLPNTLGKKLVDDAIKKWTKQHKKCLLNIGFFNKKDEPDGHVYMVSWNNEKVMFSDGEGNFAQIHKLDTEYAKLNSVVMYIYQ